jgi:indoleamine 2,3-dioxygenase
MTYWQKDGTATGLLAKNELRKTVDSSLPNLMSEINKVDKMDARLKAALFRDYSFLASAYIHESTHLSHVAGKGYGLGSPHLPEQIAIPLVHCAKEVNYG